GEGWIDLPMRGELDGVRRGVGQEIDVAARIEAYIGRHTSEEHMRRRPQRRDRNSLSLEIPQSANLFGPEQLEAADVQAPQENDRITRFDANDGRRRELAVDVYSARGQQRIRQ